MRFVFILCLLCVSIPTFAQDTFKLRIENLQPSFEYLEHAYEGPYVYSTRDHSEKDNIVNITTPLTTFQMGFAPSTVLNIAPDLNDLREFKVNLGGFMFGRKVERDKLRNSFLMSYLGTLTDGKTSYPIGLQIIGEVKQEEIYVRFSFGSPDVTDALEGFRFPQQDLTYYVTLDSPGQWEQTFKGTIDQTPLIVTVKPVRTIKDARTQRALRTSTNRKGSR